MSPPVPLALGIPRRDKPGPRQDGLPGVSSPPHPAGLSPAGVLDLLAEGRVIDAAAKWARSVSRPSGPPLGARRGRNDGPRPRCQRPLRAVR